MKSIKLGDLLELVDLRNKDNSFGVNDLIGISTSKNLIKTKATLINVDLKKYKILPMNHFVYVPDTSRRGEKIAVAFNNKSKNFILSNIYTVFKIKNELILNPNFLFMFFNRNEFDRYARFNSWGSVREIFTWNDLCNVEIEIPPIEIQNKYVKIYKSILKNIEVYKEKIEDLKTICDAYIENLRRESKTTKIKNYICKKNKKINFQNAKILKVFLQMEFL